jgi:N-acetylglucosamine-6-sulfatase
LWLAALLCVAASCSSSETSTSHILPEQGAEESSVEQPNIIFVLTDDLDYAAAQKLPEIDALLRDGGTAFENAFVSQSLCCPSRATILTGLYAHNHQVKDVKPPQGGFKKFRDEGLEEDTIAVRLQESGYRTALFGKYFNLYPEENDPTYVPPGWDEWRGLMEEGQPYQPYNYQINENGEIVSYGTGTEDYQTDILSEKAADFVRSTASDSRPFFMYVAPTDPHEPATPAERHKDAFAEEEAPRPPSFNEEDVSDKPSWIQGIDSFNDKKISEIDERYRKRLRSMLAVDDLVAALVEELEATGKLANTYIFFTSDNGFLQGEHRWNNTKDRPYEEAARVPLFVRGPGVAPGSKVENLVLNTDFAPTFAEFAGVSLPADGRSLVPLLRGEDPPWRSSVLLEGFVGKKFRAYAAVRTETHKYVEYRNGEEELYDLKADPYELESLHESANPALLEDLRTKLEALRNCAGEGCVEAEDSP